MPRGVPKQGLEDWFEMPAEKRKNLVDRWLDEILGTRGDPQATFFSRKALYRKARKYLGLRKLPPQVKRDIDQLLEKVD
jgi:hypothetical protein